MLIFYPFVPSQTAASPSAIQQSREGEVPVTVVTGDELPDVEKTFRCGQCFRFEKVENSRHACEYAGVAYGRAFSVARDGTRLFLYNITADAFSSTYRRYLGMEEDYPSIWRSFADRTDLPYLQKAADVSRGLYLLRQDPWETLCSFILSQNNNIPRIKKIIAALCHTLGDPIDARGMEAHGFPSGVAYTFPSACRMASAGAKALEPLRAGFRAGYLYDAACKVAESPDLFFSLAEAPMEQADACLRTIRGVGAKVSACTLLFGFGFYNAFPIDVWIARVLKNHFPPSFQPSSLGPYAGLAQQYLFYAARFAPTTAAETPSSDS